MSQATGELVAAKGRQNARELKEPAAIVMCQSATKSFVLLRGGLILLRVPSGVALVGFKSWIGQKPAEATYSGKILHKESG